MERRHKEGAHQFSRPVPQQQLLHACVHAPTAAMVHARVHAAPPFSRDFF
jgi:hypothetical protein